jgi:hypothetical protein
MTMSEFDAAYDAVVNFYEKDSKSVHVFIVGWLSSAVLEPGRSTDYVHGVACGLIHGLKAARAKEQDHGEAGRVDPVRSAPEG